MKIYIAASFVSQRRLRPIRDKLFHLGHSVIGSWLDEVQKPQHISQELFDRQLAIKDLGEVREADCIILDKFDPSTTGGRNVEWGFSLGFQGKLHYVVGPVEGIFERIADKQFDTWDQLFQYFDTNHKTERYIATGMSDKEFSK